MSHEQVIILSAISVYFVFMVAIGIYSSRNQNHEGFVIGGRNVGYIPTIGSLASSFRDGMGIVFWFGFGAVTGYGGIWAFIGVIIGLFIYAFLGPRVREIAAEHNYITIGEMVRARMGVVTERLTAMLVIAVALMFVAVQLYVSGRLFAEILGMDAWIGVWSVAFVVGFYLFFGGYSNVVKTDAVQFFLIVSLIVVPFFLPPPREAVADFDSLWSLGTETIIAFTMFGALFVLSSADTWQRVFSARSAKVIKVSFPVSGVFLVIMTLSLIFLGMASKPFLGEGINAGDAFYRIFSAGFIPTPLLAYIAVVSMAICMSTLDTMCYLTASTISKNYMARRVTEERGNYVKFSRVVMLLILAGMSVLAITISDVILFAFNAASLLFVLAPVYIFTVLGKPERKSRRMDLLISMSVAVTCVIYLFMFSHGYLEELKMTIVPALISTALVSLSLYFGQFGRKADG